MAAYAPSKRMEAAAAHPAGPPAPVSCKGKTKKREPAYLPRVFSKSPLKNHAHARTYTDIVEEISTYRSAKKK